MSNPNRRGTMALVSASLCLALAALFYFAEPAPSLTASAPAAVPAAADWGLSFPTEGESPAGNVSAEDLARGLDILEAAIRTVTGPAVETPTATEAPAA